MTLLNRICALIVALTMIATTSAMASMRDGDAGAQRIVICTGMGAQVILLGADGQEVDPAPICPDCTMVFTGVTPPHFSVPHPVIFETIARTASPNFGVGVVASAQNQPRAPPVLAL